MKCVDDEVGGMVVVKVVAKEEEHPGIREEWSPKGVGGSSEKSAAFVEMA